MNMYFELGSRRKEARYYGRNQDYRSCKFTAVTGGADVVLVIEGTTSEGWSATNRIMLPVPAAEALGRALTALSAVGPKTGGTARFLHDGGNTDEPVQGFTFRTGTVHEGLRAFAWEGSSHPYYERETWEKPLESQQQ